MELRSGSLKSLSVDRNSLFQRCGRAPDKSTVKRRFRAISVTMRCCNTNVWRHCDSLATRLLRGVVSSDFPALGGVRVAGESGKVPCDSHGDFLCRVCHTCFSALDRTPNPQSEPAVIVRHRIVKPRLDDELAALEDARHRFLVFNKSGEVQTPKVIVTAATIESRRLDDFIFALLEVEQPENLEHVQDNPK